jgi:phosphoglycerate dehydrogenase-like enzyme
VPAAHDVVQHVGGATVAGDITELANVVITPHVASDADLTDDCRFAVFAENLRRFDAGEPLLNVVDKRAGY